MDFSTLGFNLNTNDPNIINHWGLDHENSPKFQALCARVANDEKASPSQFDWQGRLAHEFTIGAYRERTRKKGIAGLTGEWLIFAKYNGLNYYLCISRHTSGKGDQDVFEFLKLLCQHENLFYCPDKVSDGPAALIALGEVVSMN